MRIWQQSMIFLARNQAVKNFMQNKRNMSQLAARFVGGSSAETATDKTRLLKTQGIHCSLFNLGEYVEDQKIINHTLTELETVIHQLADENLDIHVSVDPTQIGYQIDPEQCYRNCEIIARTIKKADVSSSTSSKHLLMIDMEDSQVTGITLDIYHRLNQQDLPVAVTLQAYLHRTRNDIEKIVHTGGMVRLVKGAFAEPSAIAFTEQKAIDANYLQLAELMLSAKAKSAGFYPIFGTHDDKMIQKIITLARKQSWKKGEYEFEMLYGVRPRFQQNLIESGEKLRLYLPFGEDWWPYAVRRIGESMKNVKFLFKALIGN